MSEELKEIPLSPQIQRSIIEIKENMSKQLSQILQIILSQYQATGNWEISPDGTTLIKKSNGGDNKNTG